MAIKRRGEAQTSERTDPIPNLEAGEHEGRLRYVIDLGLHIREWAGERKADVQKLSLGIEIVGETVELDGKEQPRLLWYNPFNVYHTMSEQGDELGIYKVFSPTAREGEVADWDSVIDEPCNVTIIHTKGKGDNADRIYDNIDILSATPAKYKSGVEVGLIKDGCTGDAEDESSPAQKAMYGLVSWVFGKRIVEEVPTPQAVLDNVGDGGIDDDIPF